MNNPNILAPLPGACREWPCGATGALQRIPPTHPYLSALLFLGF